MAYRYSLPGSSACDRKADSRFASSQRETALLCNDVSYWLGASLESAMRSPEKNPFSSLVQVLQISIYNMLACLFRVTRDVNRLFV